MLSPERAYTEGVAMDAKQPAKWRACLYTQLRATYLPFSSVERLWRTEWHGLYATWAEKTSISSVTTIDLRLWS